MNRNYFLSLGMREYTCLLKINTCMFAYKWKNVDHSKNVYTYSRRLGYKIGRACGKSK